ncbi:MAG: PAS domain-containing protein [Gammaproteobacteria bacterium]|nr:PAS domain-containing protein [Gammaproteobacteria bacterium]
MSSKISFKEIISYMPGTVYWMGLDHVYLGCNLNLARILKKNSPDEVIGATIYDLTPDKVVADFIHQIDHQVMQYDKEIALEENAFDANGHPAVYFTKKQPLHDDQGNVVGMLGVSIDITDRKRAEEAAIKAKEMAEAANKVKTEFLASMTHDVKTPLSGMIGITELLASRAKNKDDKKLLGDLHESGKELMSFF